MIVADTGTRYMGCPIVLQSHYIGISSSRVEILRVIVIVGHTSSFVAVNRDRVNVFLFYNYRERFRIIAMIRYGL